ncbi:hypothetical protein PHMEG_00022069 [Phytophthora megakarya]|uniref:Uncharacterized protein n=1 Tax=Phytophthora megakarya TaxID=4795 RepID=A0A225VJQ3_9STRA|nr:hypothetical protein PHMEG_00022069 [Phytophthora megakarya]
MLEGITTFASAPASSYRYTIKLHGDKISIWMEDRGTKQQWLQDDLNVGDYVTTANIIPNATRTDYAEFFHDALKCDLNDSSLMQRKLTVLKEGVLQLELMMHLKFFWFTWTAKYAFILKPVTVERFAVLESKLRDLQENLEQLRRDIIKPTKFVELWASSRADNSNLCWNVVDSDDFVVCGDGNVEICCSGVYSIQAFVLCAPTAHNVKIQLLKNGTSIQVRYCISVGGNYSSTPLGLITQLDEDDELSIKCDIKVASSSLSIVRLGN